MSTNLYELVIFSNAFKWNDPNLLCLLGGKNLLVLHGNLNMNKSVEFDNYFNLTKMAKWCIENYFMNMKNLVYDIYI